ncbi:FAD-dependent oxidoreductase, partial [Erysipelatoclostridium ramosum]
EIHTGVDIGKDIAMCDLDKEFDAVYLAIGAQTDKKVGIPGEDGKNVISAVTMLRKIGDDIMPDFTGKRVLVIGGGNVAMDVA